MVEKELTVVVQREDTTADVVNGGHLSTEVWSAEQTEKLVVVVVVEGERGGRDTFT